MSNEVKEKLKIVADHLGIEEEKVTEEASFIDDLGADSLDTVELVWLKKSLVQISDKEAEKISTVMTPLNLLRAKQLKYLLANGS